MNMLHTKTNKQGSINNVTKTTYYFHATWPILKQFVDKYRIITNVYDVMMVSDDDNGMRFQKLSGQWFRNSQSRG